MQMTDLFLDELEKQAAATRRALERVPESRNDWKPHDKSMPLGYLAAHIATLPEWIAMVIESEALNFGSPESQKYIPRPAATNAELLQALDESVAKARNALANTTDDHLMKPWRFMIHEKVVSEEPRYRMIRDMTFGHLAHHRGQLVVYLRLNEIPVPGLYGPSADERSF